MSGATLPRHTFRRAPERSAKVTRAATILGIHPGVLARMLARGVHVQPAPAVVIDEDAGPAETEEERDARLQGIAAAVCGEPPLGLTPQQERESEARMVIFFADRRQAKRRPTPCVRAAEPAPAPAPPLEMQDLLSVVDVAQRLHCHTETVKRYLAAGHFPGAHRLAAGAGPWRIPPSGLAAYLRANVREARRVAALNA